LRLFGVGAEWARFSTDVFGAKAHVVYDPDLGRPVYHAVTAANVNDISAAKAMPIGAGATYVFGLGYYDFGFWAKLDALGCQLVTRFKSNTPLNEPREMPLEPGTTVLGDRIGFLPARHPVASGWSGCRVGLAPTGKRRLVTAHTSSGHRDGGRRSRKPAVPPMAEFHAIPVLARRDRRARGRVGMR
jgi:DDE family transposase